MRRNCLRIPVKDIRYIFTCFKSTFKKKQVMNKKITTDVHVLVVDDDKITHKISYRILGQTRTK